MHAEVEERRISGIAWRIPNGDNWVEKALLRSAILQRPLSDLDA